MNEGTPQGSPLSPVLWLAFVTRSLRAPDQAALQPDPDPPMGTRPSTRSQTRDATTTSSAILSYVDDVNTVVVSKGCTKNGHDRGLEKVNQALVEAGAADGLRWDKSKETRVNFERRQRTHSKILGVLWNSALDWRKHITTRVSKAKSCLWVLLRTCTSHSGLSPRAARNLYTGCIRPLITYGAELWFDPLAPGLEAGLEQVSRRPGPRQF